MIRTSVAPDSTGQQDLGSYLRVLWRWKYLFVAIVVLIPLGVYLYERSRPKVYQSNTLVELQDVSAQTLGASGAPVVSGNLAAVARLVTTTPVINTAARLLSLPPGLLANEVSASADPTTGFLTITAHDHDPARAAAIANAFAAALNNHQARQATRVINRQIRALQEQLAAAHGNPGEQVTLSQQIVQLQALTGSSSSGSTVVQAATPSHSAVSPKTRRAVEFALVIALLLGVGAVSLAEGADRRLRAPDDIEGLTGWPLLAAIPPSAFFPDRLGEPRNEEAFQMLGTALTYFNVEQPLSSVAIVSAQTAAGKTTVAAGLALATARAGKRAILVDGDLRRPQIGARMGIAADAGLGDVLAGERKLGDALVEYPMDAPESGRLLVLPAGSPPPNPTALLRSPQMRALVRDLEGQADLVIVDTVAALLVSDALPLIGAVSGVVVVVRMNRTSTASVRRLQKMIGSAYGTVLGAVATGSGAVARGSGGYYPYGYGDRQRGALGILRRRHRAPIAVDTRSSNGAVAADEAAVARDDAAVAPDEAARPADGASAEEHEGAAANGGGRPRWLLGRRGRKESVGGD